MSVGTPYTRASVDQSSGGICSRLRALFSDVAIFKEWLDSVGVDDLIALGYTSGEADTMKSTFSDVDGLGLLAMIYDGASGLPNPIDFSVGATRLSGPGLP